MKKIASQLLTFVLTFLFGATHALKISTQSSVYEKSNNSPQPEVSMVISMMGYDTIKIIEEVKGDFGTP